jgi:F0F1-type ATP synthase membrane subunit b/b'
MDITTKLSLRAAALAAFVLVVFVGAADVASAGSGNRPPALSDLTFYWINFILYIGAMTFILRKPIRNAWAARTARIKKTVAECTDEVDAAERELNAIEALTKGLANEQDRVRQDIISQANLEASDILRQANQRAVRIREQAKEMLKGETRSAESAFRASLVSRALQSAKERFARGEFAGREQSYVEAAVNRSKQLVQ